MTRLAKWKENRRHKDALRVPVNRPCEKCGRIAGRGKMTRHHEWETGFPGKPPRVAAVLCRDCHAELERGCPLKDCRWCRATFRGKRSRREHEKNCPKRVGGAPPPMSPWVVVAAVLVGLILGALVLAWRLWWLIRANDSGDDWGHGW